MSGRSLSWVGLAVAGFVALAATAATAFANPPPVMPRAYTFVPEHPAATAAAPAGSTSPYIFINRCVGGCSVKGGTVDDARTLQSTLPCPSPQCQVGFCSCPGGSNGTWTVREFENQFGQNSSGTGSTPGTGTCYGDGTTQCTADAQCSGTCPAGGGSCSGGTHAGTTCTSDADCADTCDTADYEWNQVMQCIKDVYSPFNVMVSDVPPAGASSYTEDILAGQPADIGYGGGAGVGGIAPGGCDARNNILSFSFSNINWGSGQDRIWTLCGVAAQETAHAFGLEHEYQVLDAYTANMGSTCNDPMTYRTDCGGEKFFRDAPAYCGEFMQRDCVCGGTQNSYQKILDVFGPGQSIVPPPTSQILLPAANAMVSNGFNVAAQAGSRRGVTKVELWLNGYKWGEAPGAAFGANGQPNPAVYQIKAPNNVPDGVIDVVVKAYDDLGAETDSQTVTVTKGAPCTDASMCATGQKCAMGKCFWDTPSGQLGDPCTYDQFCTTGLCSPTTSDQVCSQPCTVGISDSCPAKFDCLMQNGIQGFCYPHDTGGGGGCCNAGGSPRGIWLTAGLAAMVLGLVMRRRRRGCCG